MRRGLTVVALAALACALPASAAYAAPERYIVVLQDDAGDPGAVAAEHGRSHEARADKVFRDALRGYSGVIPSERVAALRADSRVKYVEADGEVTTAAQSVPWGITKVNGHLADTVAGDGFGETTSVRAYIIDSGIAAHRDLTLAGHVNYAGGKNTDCNGHGTHVAGTVAAKDDANDVVGVAPGAPVFGVKVLGCNGSGSTSGVVAGVDFVYNAVATSRMAVANMSIGGGTSRAINDAVTRLATRIPVAVAAGNETTDACTKSPAAAGAGVNNGVITTGATDIGDRQASFSNFGGCVDLWAPGVSVLSTRRGGGTTTMSGTSMASPHMAGGAALALAKDPSLAPTAIEGLLRSEAVLTGPGLRLDVEAF